MADDLERLKNETDIFREDAKKTKKLESRLKKNKKKLREIQVIKAKLQSDNKDLENKLEDSQNDRQV